MTHPPPQGGEASSIHLLPEAVAYGREETSPHIIPAVIPCSRPAGQQLFGGYSMSKVTVKVVVFHC